MHAPVLHLSLPVGDLDAARSFYIDTVGCAPGRIREDWADVWFFGMQLTLQQRPDEVPADQGVRHFGVALDRDAFDALVVRLERAGVEWITPPRTHEDPTLSGKTNVKFADPSGNVIEAKYYPPA